MPDLNVKYYISIIDPRSGVRMTVLYKLGEKLQLHGWERQALLNRMYKQTSAIHPAPPRESLSLFGGTLSHEQYRAIIEKKVLRIDSHLPPVISILATLDTKQIDFYETSLRNTSVNATLGGAVELMKNSEPGLRLKRSKPLKDKESTLDAVMNLSVRVRS